MLDWMQRTFRSSIGRKVLVAVTGLLLIGYLILHLAGNFLIYADGEGKAFGEYAASLEANPFLPLAEVLLASLFLAHIVLAIRTSLSNREARETSYRIRAWHGGRTAGSSSMLFTGLIVLAFLLVHIYDFRLFKGPAETLAGTVRTRLAGGMGFVIYAIGIGALTLHLSHAFQSALQTLGVNHPQYSGALRRLGLVLAFLLGLGFLSFPVVFFFGGLA